jgi:hypothetical protein
MLRQLWRFLVAWSFFFWQAGFLFYSAVVVETGHQVLGRTEQGFLTQKVTFWLNIAGIVALVMLAIDWFLIPDPKRGRAWIRAGCWIGMVACHVYLFVLHDQLDALLDPMARHIESGFRRPHQIYLWTSTVQWAFALVTSWCWLAAIRDAGRREVTSAVLEGISRAPDRGP